MTKRKKELADMFVENNSGGLSQMSKEDILSLFTNVNSCYEIICLIS